MRRSVPHRWQCTVRHCTVRPRGWPSWPPCPWASPAAATTVSDDAGDTETTTTATPGRAVGQRAVSRPTQPDDDAVVLDITIADGEVTPAGETVDAKVGQQIELRVDSDAEDELHVHSNPEHEFEVKAADGQDFTFTIEQPGQVEIETHETGVVVAELVVTP